MSGLPIREDHGEGQAGEARICRDVTNWVFSKNGHDPGQLDVTLAGSSTPIRKHRRDLLTPAVIDLSVQQVTKEACHLEEDSNVSGITSEMLISAFQSQIHSIRERVNQFNAHEYLTLPEGTRVASVTRVSQPTVQRFEVDRSLT